MSNLEKYQKDMVELIELGSKLQEMLVKHFTPPELDGMHDFFRDYSGWYSESLVVLKQLLPDRLEEFRKLYESSKERKTVCSINYTITDMLRGFGYTNGVKPVYGVKLFQQQLLILESCKKRFTSSLFDIKQVVQADVFDSEIESARELLKKKFTRAAGAIAGVVLEKHLKQVLENHSIILTKKNLTLSDLSELLKNNSVIETSDWRKLGYLGDLRNLCCHNKEEEPTQEQVKELIDGTDKTLKTLF
jgi:HEPN domain-containing protein